VLGYRRRQPQRGTLTDANGVVHTLSTKKTLFIDEKGGRRIVRDVSRDVTEPNGSMSSSAGAENGERRLPGGGMPHELQQLLTPILGNCQLMLMATLTRRPSRC